jgi:phosphoglycerate kinase
MITIPTVNELDLKNKRVFYRVDYNVPVEEGVIADTTRIEETLPTLRMMRERDARIVIASHFGRPKGQGNPKDSLHLVRQKLAEMLNAEVAWAEDCIGSEPVRLSKQLGPGQILMVENLRFQAGEEKNDRDFARQLRELADVYINDAFGASHRAHASIVALPELFDVEDRAGGLLLAKELEFLQKITNSPEHPFVAILGGAKISGKIEALEAMLRLADAVLVGGGIANTFLAASGKPMGKSLVDSDSLEVARRILASAEATKLLLPADLVVTDSIENPSQVRTVEAGAVPQDAMAVDIGERTGVEYANRIASARTIFWNGPMGVFEKEEFARGTRAIAEALANSTAISVVGGGESVDAVKSSGFADRITHISTGGGASLEFISGSSLPGIEVLRKK